MNNPENETLNQLREYENAIYKIKTKTTGVYTIDVGILTKAQAENIIDFYNKFNLGEDFWIPTLTN